MKRNKLLSMFLVLAMCISLCACGGEANKTIAVGDTFGTDNVECVITELRWITSEGIVKNSIEDGETLRLMTEGLFPDMEVNGMIDVSKSNVSDTSLLCVYYSLKNIGKEVVVCEKESNGFSGYAVLPYGTIEVTYDDGYTFGVDGSGFFSTLNVLGDAVTEVMIIDVPNEVYENTDKPLKLKITIPDSKGETQEFIVDANTVE